jgi:hypothetical protein
VAASFATTANPTHIAAVVSKHLMHALQLWQVHTTPQIFIAW